jgi:Zn-dependent protease with chaperone function
MRSPPAICNGNFVVIRSDFLEVCGPGSDEIRFILGHEIGHVRRKHLLKDLLVLPGRLLPLIGNAYSWACEATCDRFGALAAGELQGAVSAMMILSAGKEYGRRFSSELFANQYRAERGFFISWHELISSYPTLSQRVSNLVAIQHGQEPPRAECHPMAYFFAVFTFSGLGGAISSTILTYLILLITAQGNGEIHRISTEHGTTVIDSKAD